MTLFFKKELHNSKVAWRAKKKTVFVFFFEKTKRWSEFLDQYS